MALSTESRKGSDIFIGFHNTNTPVLQMTPDENAAVLRFPLDARPQLAAQPDAAGHPAPIGFGDAQDLGNVRDYRNQGT